MTGTERMLPSTKRLCLFLVALALSGCDPLPHAMQPEAVQSLASHIQYIKDSHGLCYAVLVTTSYGANNVASIATVPCDKVNL